jgi:hypothetical protein
MRAERGVLGADGVAQQFAEGADAPSRQCAHPSCRIGLPAQVAHRREVCRPVEHIVAAQFNA